MLLNEISTEKVDEYLKEISDTIKKDCRPYLSQINKDKMLWRGSTNEDGAFVTKHVRNDRQPLDTPLQSHEIINRWFKKHFGVEYRSNAVFTTGRKYLAGSFGHPYMVFPINNFNFIWSPKVDDLTYYIGSSLKKEFDISSALPEEISYDDPKVKSYIYDLLEKAEYTRNDLNKAIESGHEIMINCDSYYLFSLTKHFGSTGSYYYEEFIQLLK